MANDELIAALERATKLCEFHCIEWGTGSSQNTVADAATIRTHIAGLKAGDERERAEAAKVAALTAAINAAIAEIEGGRLYDRMCCSGHECGCHGSSNADLLVFNLRQAIASGAHEGGE